MFGPPLKARWLSGLTPFHHLTSHLPQHQNVEMVGKHTIAALDERLRLLLAHRHAPKRDAMLHDHALGLLNGGAELGGIEAAWNPEIGRQVELLRVSIKMPHTVR
jgi:hypothetical protein